MSAAPGTAVFTYGSLMIPAVMEAVTGQRFEHEPARLLGFARYALRGETYPGLVEEPAAATDGILWRPIDAASVDRLDDFEGEWYERRNVIVETETGGESAAFTYVLHPDQHHRVSRRSWSRSRFESRYLQGFLSRYRGFATASDRETST